jgi:hypothetical protein
MANNNRPTKTGHGLSIKVKATTFSNVTLVDMQLPGETTPLLNIFFYLVALLQRASSNSGWAHDSPPRLHTPRISNTIPPLNDTTQVLGVKTLVIVQNQKKRDLNSVDSWQQ